MVVTANYIFGVNEARLSSLNFYLIESDLQIKLQAISKKVSAWEKED